MKAITVVIRPEGGFHPANNALAGEPSVNRLAVHHISLLDDGSVVLLYKLSGKLDIADQILSTHPDVISCEVSGTPTGIAFIHARPTEASKSILELPKRYGLALDMPLEHVRGGGVRVTFIGDDSVLQEAMSNIPEDVEIAFERIETYKGTTLLGPSLLTERQQEIAEMAVNAGYYESPRQITQEELAGQLGISTGTLAEHLQKIEARVFAQIIQQLDG